MATSLRKTSTVEVDKEDKEHKDNKTHEGGALADRREDKDNEDDNDKEPSPSPSHGHDGGCGCPLLLLISTCWWLSSRCADLRATK